MISGTINDAVSQLEKICELTLSQGSCAFTRPSAHPCSKCTSKTKGPQRLIDVINITHRERTGFHDQSRIGYQGRFRSAERMAGTAPAKAAPTASTSSCCGSPVHSSMKNFFTSRESTQPL